MTEPTFGDLVRDMYAPLQDERDNEFGQVARVAYMLAMAPSEPMLAWEHLPKGTREGWVSVDKAVRDHEASKPRVVVTAVDGQPVADA